MRQALGLSFGPSQAGRDWARMMMGPFFYPYLFQEKGFGLAAWASIMRDDGGGRISATWSSGSVFSWKCFSSDSRSLDARRCGDDTLGQAGMVQTRRRGRGMHGRASRKYATASG